jgi:hypothetical protein
MFSFLTIVGILYKVINIIFAKWTIYLTGKILYRGPKNYESHEVLYIITGLLYMILVISWFFTGHVIFGTVVLILSFISVALKEKTVAWIRTDSIISLFILFLFLYLG